jgi:hypothetical protein
MDAPTPLAPVALQPAADDGVRVTVAGLVLWAVALVVCLVQRDALAERGATWWTASAACGLVIGGGLLGYCLRRARAYREHARPGAQGPEQPAAGAAG